MKKLFIPLFLLVLSGAIFAQTPLFDTLTIFGGSSATPGLRIKRARGHDGAKERTASGDVINGIYGRAYTGSAFGTTDAVTIELQASQDWTGSNNGTKILFKVTANGATTNSTVFTINPDGSITGTGLYTVSNSTEAFRFGEPTLDINSSPSAPFIFAVDASTDVYISTGTGPSAWVKVGGQ